MFTSVGRMLKYVFIYPFTLDSYFTDTSSVYATQSDRLDYLLCSFAKVELVVYCFKDSNKYIILACFELFTASIQTGISKSNQTCAIKPPKLDISFK